MPLDKRKIDALLVEIKLIEDRELKEKQKIPHQTIQKTDQLDTKTHTQTLTEEGISFDIEINESSNINLVV